MTLQLGVLISGRGSNLQAILDAIAAGTLDARVRLVVANRPDAAGLTRAKAAGLTTAVVEHKAFGDRTTFEHALVAVLTRASCDWIVLAGFMRILTREFLSAFPERVVNIHPSLLPAFPGLDAQAQALAYGVHVTGCTVHLVDEGVDHGPILAQTTLEVEPADTRDILAGRLLEKEHALLIATLAAIASDRLSIEPAATGDARPTARWRGAPPRV